MRLYFSTSCLDSQKFSFPEKLKLFNTLSIQNVELGVLFDYELNLSKILGEYSFNYIVHHYFPPPRTDIILNLSSPNHEIRDATIIQMKRSIQFCHDFKIKFYSFHAGFRADPDLKFIFPKSQSIETYDDSFELFLNALNELSSFAAKRNIDIAFENNVLAEYNLVEGQNQFLLMCEEWEYRKLFERIDHKNLGVLLDLGHLKVSANTLAFNPENFISSIQKYVKAVHVSENNGKLDEGKIPRRNDWVYKCLENYFSENKDVYIVLESIFRKKMELKEFLDILPSYDFLF